MIETDNKVTLEQAHEKWCPIARVNGSNTAYWNGKIQIGDLVRCIGDRCMMWRWVNAEKGYCGLAGWSHDYDYD